jgi:hypothetical protein
VETTWARDRVGILPGGYYQPTSHNVAAGPSKDG